MLGLEKGPGTIQYIYDKNNKTYPSLSYSLFLLFYVLSHHWRQHVYQLTFVNLKVSKLPLEHVHKWYIHLWVINWSVYWQLLYTCDLGTSANKLPVQEAATMNTTPHVSCLCFPQKFWAKYLLSPRTKLHKQEWHGGNINLTLYIPA